MRILENIVHVFFGTPRRAGWTLGILAIIFFAFFPGVLVTLVKSVMNNVVVPVISIILTTLANAIGPLMGSIITILLVIFGFKLMLKSLKGGKK